MRGLFLMKMVEKSFGDEVAFQQGQHVLYFTTFHASAAIHTSHFLGIANHSLTGTDIAKRAASFFSIIPKEEMQP